MMAAGRPEAPAPTMTTSAVWSQRIRLCGAALVSDTPAPVRAVTPTPSAALSLMNFLRLTLKFFGFLLMFFFLATNKNLYERRVLLAMFNSHESSSALDNVNSTVPAYRLPEILFPRAASGPHSNCRSSESRSNDRKIPWIFGLSSMASRYASSMRAVGAPVSGAWMDLVM